MNQTEWESLCDGCGKCCLHKIEDEDTNELFYTRIACVLLDVETCRCRDYSHRVKHVPECLRLKPEDVSGFYWLPKTCAYRLISEAKPLESWHPLVSGSPDSVHQQGVSVQRWAINEDKVSDGDWVDYVLDDIEL